MLDMQNEKMKDILIYGYGGLGREVACLISKINDQHPRWNVIGYIDDGVPMGTCCKYGEVIGNIDTLNVWDKPVDVAIAIGSPRYLKEVSQKITNPLVNFPNIVAPNTFYFDESAVQMGVGNIIGFGCRFSCNVAIGNFNVLDGCISLGHDAVVGSYNMLFPEVRISGQTIIGDENYFGSRCFAAQCIKIGNNNRFGAGAFILRKIKDNGLYMGNPAKKVSID